MTVIAYKSGKKFLSSVGFLSCSSVGQGLTRKLTEIRGLNMTLAHHIASYNEVVSFLPSIVGESTPLSHWSRIKKTEHLYIIYNLEYRDLACAN